MALKQTLDIYELLDSAVVRGSDVSALFAPFADLGITIEVTTVHNEVPEDHHKVTDFISIMIPGTQGKINGGDAPTLGIIGRNGAIGGRPGIIGMVSDADGPIGSLAAGLKIAQMKRKGDHLIGDVIVTTHLSTDVTANMNRVPPFMGMPVSSETMNIYEVHQGMDAILSLDASKGNRLIKQRGFAISPTAKEGYILKVSADLLSAMENATGKPAVTFPISIQDITPYSNGLYHFNSIMQPHIATNAPVVGVAIIAQAVVAGSASSANHEIDLAEAVQFCIEVAKQYGQGKCAFYDAAEFDLILKKYIPLNIFQTAGHA